MSALQPCPICGSRVSNTLLGQHMAGHSKDEILATLLERSQSRSSPSSSSSSNNDSTVVISTNTMDLSSNPRPVSVKTGPTPLPAAPATPGGAATPFPPLPMMPGSNAGATNAAGIPPLFMPQMMGMMQVMSSPCLIPQPNGPPLLINMPSYVYPNMMGGHGGLMNHPNLLGNGLLGGPATPTNILPSSGGATTPQVVLPTHPVPSSMAQMMSMAAAGPSPSPLRAASSSLSAAPQPSTSGFSSPLTKTEPRPGTSASGLPVIPQDLSARISSINEKVSSGSSSSLTPSPVKIEPMQVEDDVDTTISSDDGALEEEETKENLAQNEASPVLPVAAAASPEPGPSRPRKASGPMKLKIKNRKDIAVKSKSSAVATVQDTLLSETSSEREANPLLSSQYSSSATSVTETKPLVTKPPGDGVFGYTQYAEDSPYPAASLNFSALLDSQTAASTSSLDQPSCSTSTAGPSTPVVKPQPADDDDEPICLEDSKGRLCTVQTVSDLQNALKSDDDVQIVVPNELLETTEFKSFISTLNSFPLHESASPGQPSTSGSSSEAKAPPNTPITTRPPSAAAMEEPLSPQPCGSRDASKGGFEDNPASPVGILSTTNLSNDSDDDDITLQDLLATETMEDACDDDDEFFTLSSSTNPLEPFMNSILTGQAEERNVFTCEKCGLRFGSILGYREHRDVCEPTGKQGKGKKSAKGKAKSSASISRPPPDENATASPPNEAEEAAAPPAWEILPDLIKTEVKSEIKAESMDSNSQPVLGGPGHHWKCNQCKVVFETGPQLLEHLDLMRRAEHKCSSCHILFDDRKTLLIHRRKLHPAVPKIKVEPPTAPREFLPNENGEYVCDKCDRAFKDKELMIKHMSCHDEEKPFECLECGKKFAKASLLRDHRRRHFEVGQFECGYCQKRFYTPNKLREHVRVHTGEAPLACNVCGRTFKRHSNLSEHKRIHQENRPVKPQKELFCHCGKVFKTQRDLDWHKEGVHDKQPKKCTYCGEVFVHSSSLTRHVRLKHESNFLPENKKSSLYAKCPVCQQTFYKTSINKHIRIKHQNQKPFQCDVCKASFVTKCNLTNHQWQHKGVRARPFKCQLCRKAYLRQSLLDAHMRSHRGVKPFVCNECGLQFANKSNWQRHVAEHSGTRDYECPHCHKRFSRGYYLTDHLKVHTGEKPYVCGICGKPAATRSNYNSHMRTHITREPVNSEV